MGARESDYAVEKVQAEAMAKQQQKDAVAFVIRVLIRIR